MLCIKFRQKNIEFKRKLKCIMKIMDYRVHFAMSSNIQGGLINVAYHFRAMIH